MVKTAVLMATYNGEKFISEQLDSIRQQTLKPDYVLLRDDCSTDETVNVVNNYIAKHGLEGWKIVKNDKNLGWRLNFRQLLIDVLAYEVDYVFFSDQDDIWYLDKNERQFAIMSDNPQIEVLSADVDIKTMSTEASVPHFLTFSSSDRISQYPKVYDYQTFRPGWTIAMKRDFAQAIADNWTFGANISHDNLIETTASIIGNGYNLNESVGVHIRYGGNASGNSKFVLNWKSSKTQHITGLKTFVDFYETMQKVVNKYQNDVALNQRLAFEKERLEASKLSLIHNSAFVIKNWRFYNSNSGRMRDLLFAFKK
ncbi:glycosyltransferase family 2 protein [Streptococcus agalactiae]|nr:glycosyltransferase family 2 protein [Streptococcus agalactiae]